MTSKAALNTETREPPRNGEGTPTRLKWGHTEARSHQESAIGVLPKLCGSVALWENQDGRPEAVGRRL
jgi:hypothetical protein